MSTKKHLKSCIFSESLDLKKKNRNKIKKSTQWFLGNATYNSCVKFHGKIVNPILVGAPGNFRFLNKRHGFW